MLIDTLAYTNRLRARHPGEKMLLTLVPLAGVLLTDSPWILALIILGMTLFTLVKIGITPHVYGKLLLIPSVFILMGVFPLLFETGQPTVPPFISIPIGGSRLCATSASIRRGGELVLKSLASISCFYGLVLSTPVNDVLYVLGRIGVPPLLVEMMSLIYRYISVFIQTAHQMYLAQKNRLGYGSFKKALVSLGMLASTVFVRVLLKSTLAYNALLSRGYRGEIVTLKDIRPLNRRALARILWLELVLFVLIVWNSGVM